MDGMWQPPTGPGALRNGGATDIARPRRIDPDVIAMLQSAMLLWDFCSVVLCGSVSAHVYCWIFPDRVFDVSWHGSFGRQVLLQACICTLLLRESGATPARSRLIRTMASLPMVVIAFGLTLSSLHDLSGAWVLLWSAMTLVLVLGGRCIRDHMMTLLRRRGRLRQLVAVVGAGPRAESVMGHLRRTASDHAEIIGLYDDRRSRMSPNCQVPVGTLADLLALGRTLPPDWIIITLPPSADRRIAALLHDLKSLPAQIAICADAIEEEGHCASLAGLRLRVIASPPLHRWSRLAKAIEDRGLGLLLLLLASPVMLAIAIAVRLDSRGPVLFRQLRHGWNGVPFQILKFRTMSWQPEDDSNLRQTQPHDPRVTRLGRILRATSLDELPQLINVLRGEMSLVGPRPHALTMRTQDRLGPQIVAEYAHRHRVKPGMTGWAQIHGLRGATNTADQLRRRVEHDLHYIDNWSLLLDLQILLRTARHMLVDRNAY